MLFTLFQRIQTAAGGALFITLETSIERPGGSAAESYASIAGLNDLRAVRRELDDKAAWDPGARTLTGVMPSRGGAAWTNQSVA